MEKGDTNRLFSQRVIGHRGGSGSFGPENLLWTLKKAVAVGVKLLEFDIRTTNDGVLVICHDDEHWFGTVSAMDFQDLRRIDAAYHWSPDDGATYPLRGKGLQIASLVDIFEEFVGNAEILFFLDCKAIVAKEVFALVDHYNLEARVIVGAMDSVINADMLLHKPKNVPSACSLKDTIALIGKWSVPLNWMWFGNFFADFVHDVVMFPYGYPNCSFFLAHSFVELCHANNKKVWVFGPDVNQKETTVYLLNELKVDAVISDRPDEALKLL